jgi:Phosphodiester glycosidase
MISLEFAVKLALKSFAMLLILLVSATIGESEQKRLVPETNQKPGWQQLDKGLDLGIFPAPQAAANGDSLVRVLRIDPKYFQLRLLNASQVENGVPLTPKQWCRQNGMVAAINPSMYQTDYKTSVSLMRTKIHTNNPRLSKDMTILAFDRQRAGVPQVKIIDRQCEDFQSWKQRYGTLVQSIRMISCTGKNVWKPQARRWSTSAIGVDEQDRVLFMHVRALYSMHDLINILKKLPLNISRAMYTEGGPQAQLYINSGQELELTGSYDTNSNEANKDSIAWPLPNVIGILKR